MILDLIFFPIFMSLLYALGAGVLYARKAALQQPYPSYYVLAVALFFIGFLSVVMNFFTGVDSPVTYGILAAMTLLGLVRLRHADAGDIKTLLLFALALAPMTMNMRPQADAGLYHIPQQLWIRDEKIVFGLANFHNRFGFSSMLEYISAPLWLGEHFKLLAYAMAGFAVILLLFLRETMKNPSLFVFGFLTALGLIINSNYLDFEYASTDTPTGILFALTFFSGIFLLLETRDIRRHLTMFLLLAVFCLTLKASGVVMGVWVAFVVGKLLYEKRIGLRGVGGAAVVPTLLTVIWALRGFILSGCLLFPAAASCVRDLPWSAWESAKQAALGVTLWARNPRGGDFSLEDWSWLTVWWIPNNWVFCLGIALMATLVLWAYRRAFAATIAMRRDVALPAFLFVLLSLAVWFFNAPTPRFAMGIFMILPVSLAFLSLGLRDASQITLPQPLNSMQGLCSVLIMCVICKFSGYGAYQSVRYAHGDWSFHTLPAPVAEVIAHPNSPFGFRPVKELCWTAKYCVWDDHPNIREVYGYKYFGY